MISFRVFSGHTVTDHTVLDYAKQKSSIEFGKAPKVLYTYCFGADYLVRYDIESFKFFTLVN